MHNPRGLGYCEREAGVLRIELDVAEDDRPGLRKVRVVLHLNIFYGSDDDDDDDDIQITLRP